MIFVRAVRTRVRRLWNGKHVLEDDGWEKHVAWDAKQSIFYLGAPNNQLSCCHWKDLSRTSKWMRSTDMSSTSRAGDIERRELSLGRDISRGRRAGALAEGNKLRQKCKYTAKNPGEVLDVELIGVAEVGLKRTSSAKQTAHTRHGHVIVNALFRFPRLLPSHHRPASPIPAPPLPIASMPPKRKSNVLDALDAATVGSAAEVGTFDASATVGVRASSSVPTAISKDDGAKEPAKKKSRTSNAWENSMDTSSTSKGKASAPKLTWQDIELPGEAEVRRKTGYMLGPRADGMLGTGRDLRRLQ
jgi:hypothetical protein